MSEIAKIVLTGKQKDAFEFKVAKAMHLLLSSKPLYYYMLAKLNRSTNPDFPAPAAVVMDKTSFQIKLVLNPVMLAECTPQDLKIVFEHEVLHLCFKHLFNITKFNASVYNQAADYIINDNIEDLVARYEELLGPAPSNKLFSKLCLAPVLQKAIPELQDKRIAQMDSLTLYKLLMENQDKTPQQNLMDSHDGKDMGEDGEGSTPGKSIPQSLVDKLMSDAAKEASAHKDQGRLPAEVEARVKELTKSKTDYKRLLKNFVSTLKHPEKQRTWLRRNRKYPVEVRGKRDTFLPKLVIIIDTSGSMVSEKVHQAIAGEIKACSQTCGEIWVIAGDTKETFRLKITGSKFKVESLKFTGGGGTDLQFGWTAAKLLKADGVICYTDGYISSFEAYGKNTLFCIYPGGKDVPGFKNIKMEI